jgi:3-dehydroquinate dehydratase
VWSSELAPTAADVVHAAANMHTAIVVNATGVGHTATYLR